MKRVLCLAVVVSLLVPVLALAEDGPAFNRNKIKNCEYQTTGLMTRKDSSANEYLGSAEHKGFLTEVSFIGPDQSIIGVSQVTPDLFVAIGGIANPYVCRFFMEGYTWNKSKSKITDDDVSMTCWDYVGDPNRDFPLIDQTDCTASIKFKNPTRFRGVINCDTGSMKWTWGLNGKKLGKYDTGSVSPILNHFGGLESFFYQLR